MNTEQSEYITLLTERPKWFQKLHVCFKTP